MHTTRGPAARRQKAEKIQTFFASFTWNCSFTRFHAKNGPFLCTVSVKLWQLQTVSGQFFCNWAETRNSFILGSQNMNIEAVFTKNEFKFLQENYLFSENVRNILPSCSKVKHIFWNFFNFSIVSFFSWVQKLFFCTDPNSRQVERFSEFCYFKRNYQH